MLQESLRKRNLLPGILLLISIVLCFSYIAEAQDAVTIYCGLQVSSSEFDYPDNSNRRYTKTEFDNLFAGNAKERYFKSQVFIDEIFVRYGYNFSELKRAPGKAVYGKFIQTNWYQQAINSCPTQDMDQLMNRYMNSTEIYNISLVNEWQMEVYVEPFDNPEEIGWRIPTIREEVPIIYETTEMSDYFNLSAQQVIDLFDLIYDGWDEDGLTEYTTDGETNSSGIYCSPDTLDVTGVYGIQVWDQSFSVFGLTYGTPRYEVGKKMSQLGAIINREDFYYDDNTVSYETSKWYLHVSFKDDLVDWISYFPKSAMQNSGNSDTKSGKYTFDKEVGGVGRDTPDRIRTLAGKLDGVYESRDDLYPDVFCEGNGIRMGCNEYADVTTPCLYCENDGNEQLGCLGVFVGMTIDEARRATAADFEGNWIDENYVVHTNGEFEGMPLKVSDGVVTGFRYEMYYTG